MASPHQKVLELTTTNNGAALPGHVDPTAPSAATAPSPPASTENQATANCIVGYPPVIGYPQDQGHFHPYAYPYTAPRPIPAANYYLEPNSSLAAPPVVGYNSSYFKCGIVMAVSLSIFLVLTTSIVLHIVLRSKDPIFRVYDFSVSNFTTSNSTVTANWEANITVENPCKRLRVEFINMESQITYKDDFTLAWNMDMAPLHLGKAATTFITVKMSGPSSEDPDAVQDMKKELRSTKKSLSFGLVLDMSAKFKHSWWWTKNVDKSFFCDDLKVNLAGDLQFGSLSESNEPISCVALSSL